MSAINENTDFWKLAMDFATSILPNDAETKLVDYLNNSGMNQNEQQLFCAFLREAFGFHITTAKLKATLSLSQSCQQSTEKT